jgi:hypothetical protein
LCVQRRGLDHAGGVDEDLDWAERLPSRRDQLEGLTAIGEIGHLREDTGASRRSSAPRASIRSAVVEVIATLAPRPASSRAAAKPIPSALPQPVTSAFRPVKSKGLSATTRPSP